ncbi:hypothetical protein UA08_02687 [Talaromyces atroroseus]|uniref:Xylanolytic transcriptional activator regulatory domain-containing protein n=1 Tax=Talaromyces atroroseus TaxID=1441469 RepID=A0A225B544_TALAT|nr:hypothetical protein UA08_02687 [Talaromyces atroroseus]OKL61985.1 hypothetical protein UA08_02687 [Talaromyces atroroseus]
MLCRRTFLEGINRPPFLLAILTDSFSYVQSLNDRIEELSSQLALQFSRPVSTPGSGEADSDDSFHVLMPGPGKNLYLDLSLPSRITRVTYEVLAGQQKPNGISAMIDDYNSNPPGFVNLDRSLLTPGTIRFLLGCYDRCIRPQYGILIPETLHYDGMNLQKQPDMQKFNILMACAISAARESYHSPHWKPFAQLCRDWAADLITPIILPANVDSLTAILLLLIYELADPSRGSLWELLDLATRTCLQQGWHKTITALYPSLSPLGSGENADAGAHNEAAVRLLSILRGIEG